MNDPRIPIAQFSDPNALAAWLGQGGPSAVLTDTEVASPGAVAVERFSARATHRFGCACCAGRSAAAVALDRLFQARARGRCPWFDRVGVLGSSPATTTLVDTALREDALTLARYRPG